MSGHDEKINFVFKEQDDICSDKNEVQAVWRSAVWNAVEP